MNDHATGQRAADFEILRAEGILPYPDRFEATYPNIGDIPETESMGLAVAGRVTAIRDLGKLVFVVLSDVTGAIQASVTRGGLGRKGLEIFKTVCNVGDFIGITGDTFRSRTGQFTVGVNELAYLGLSLRRLPEKWHGLADIESRYRQRYLDVIANARSREVVLARSCLISAMRRFFEQHGFFEIETPVLNNTQSGALAKPFKTHHNALDADMYLRIAPETYLKRANAAGFNRVFEFAKCFRNEGISREHLQEFTMLEYYGAYWNFRDNMEFTQAMLKDALQETFGTLKFPRSVEHEEADPSQLDFSGEWPTVTFRDVIEQGCGVDIHRECDFASLFKACARKSIVFDAEAVDSGNYGRIVDELYKKVARPLMVQPTFLIGHPIEASPLARRNDGDPRIVDRYHLVVCGTELVNAYSELVDPVDQRRRLVAQAAFRQEGDTEAMEMDEDYLRCMEHGMPPISGTGIGIARLLMTVMDLKNIKEAVLFPLLRGK